MSRSWREELRITLRPDRVAMTRIRRGLRWRVMAQNTLQCSNANANGDSWQTPLHLLADALKEPEWSRAASASIILSNHFFRYLVLRWPDAINSSVERKAYATHRFAEIHGEPARSWVLRLDARRRRQSSSIASALDRALLNGLRDVFRGTGIALYSIQPYLMVCFNANRVKLNGRTRWFVVHEPGRLTLALVGKNGWITSANRRVPENWGQEFSHILDQENLLLDQECFCTDVLLVAPEYETDVKNGQYSIERAGGHPSKWAQLLDAPLGMTAPQGLS